MGTLSPAVPENIIIPSRQHYSLCFLYFLLFLMFLFPPLVTRGQRLVQRKSVAKQDLIK